MATKQCSLVPEYVIPGQISNICKQPVTYRRGYDTGSMNSLEFFVKELFQVFHSIEPSVNLLDTGLRWNTLNCDPLLYIEGVIYKVWDDIMRADEHAIRLDMAAPVYEVPTGDLYIPVNLRCNDYMDIRQLIKMVISDVEEVYNAKHRINA